MLLEQPDLGVEQGNACSSDIGPCDRTSRESGLRDVENLLECCASPTQHLATLGLGARRFQHGVRQRDLGGEKSIHVAPACSIERLQDLDGLPQCLDPLLPHVLDTHQQSFVVRYLLLLV